MVERFSYSPQAGHLSLSFRAWWGDSLTRPTLDISGHRSARGGEIPLLAPSWTSLVVVRRVKGRFYYLPQAGHLSSSVDTSWRDSLTRHGLDISRHRSTRRGEILLLAPGWARWLLFGVWWGDFLTRPGLDISLNLSDGGEEILLLAPG